MTLLMYVKAAVEALGNFLAINDAEDGLVINDAGDLLLYNDE